MKLEPDCVRAIVLYLEESEKTGHLMKDICNGIPEYSKKQLRYTIDRLYEGGYINVNYLHPERMELLSTVNSLTYEGHLLADTFHDETTWRKALKRAKELGVMSIPKLVDIIIDIAKGMVPIL